MVPTDGFRGVQRLVGAAQHLRQAWLRAGMNADADPEPAGIEAELKDPVRRKIERYELTRTIDPTKFFPTVEVGVAAFRELSTGTADAPGRVS